MRKLLVIPVVALFLFQYSANAQQIHYSQFFLSPHTTNPAQVGLFEGTVRFGGIYRGQWLGNLAESGFNTPSIYVDAPVMPGIRKQDWIGVGGGLVNDAAGVAPITTTNFNIGLTYHLALGDEQFNVISLGVQTGSSRKNISPNLTFEDELRLLPTREANDLIGQPEGYADWAAGINWRQKMNDRMSFNLGYAMYHINEPEVSLLQAADSIRQPRIPRKSVASGSFMININEGWNLEPMFLIQSIVSDNEMLIGLNGYKMLKNEKQAQIGMGYRLQDALVFYLGLQTPNWRVGMSYDLTTSQLSDYNPVTFEIGGFYILKKYKEPEIKPYIFCPRF